MNFMNPLYAPSSPFQFSLSPEKLDEILDERTQTIELNPVDAFNALAPSDKEVVQHLVRASAAINDVFLMQDHARNLEARAFLQNEIRKGNDLAKKALILFEMNNGIQGYDLYAPQTTSMPLFKGMERPDGGNLFPPDATKEEIVAYLLAHPERASSIIGNNSRVIREGKDFAGLPYSCAYQAEMHRAAGEILKAASYATQEEFANFLRLQADALANDSDPETAYRADVAWVSLPENLPLEFAITRENYDDYVTGEIFAIPEIAALFKANGVIVEKKDFLGARLGIVNPKAAERLSRYRDQLPAFNKGKMPLLKEYDHQFGGATQKRGMDTLVDAFLISMAGDAAISGRGMCAVAECLPNSDKLCVRRGHGRRVVFHHQIYDKKFGPDYANRLLSATLDVSQRCLFDPATYLNFLVGHELGHSLGPVKSKDGLDKVAALGKWGSTIEESSADLISVLLSDYMVGRKIISQKEHQTTLMTWLVWNFPTKKVTEVEPHRLRTIAQLNYFKEKGAVQIQEGKPFKMDEPRLVHAAREMLTDVTALQLEGSASHAEQFIKRYAVWDDDMADLARRTLSAGPKLYVRLFQPLRDKLLAAPAL